MSTFPRAQHDQRSFLRRHPLIQETTAQFKRLLIQLKRRPSALVVGLLQPLIWLVLFGALFNKSSITSLPEGMGYGRFLASGLIVFTSFNASLNAGLAVMFDREFGFLNRLLVAPLRSRYSIAIASMLFITATTLLQCLVIFIFAGLLGYGWPNPAFLPIGLFTLLLLTTAVTSISLGLAFTLPGHVELLAVTVLINLPLLFTSTALAPTSQMPAWLEWLATLNPLTWAIEPIRAGYSGNFTASTHVLMAPFGSLSISSCLVLLALFSLISQLMLQPLLKRKLS
ncbi:MAG: ABC transporter permease [bacterium]